MAYNNSADALKELLILREYGGRITKAPEKPHTSSNGLSYYFAEVTCNDGDTYIIEAYGREALQLYDECASFRERRIPVTA